MNEFENIIILISFTTTLVGAIIGFLISRKLFRKKKYSPSNSQELLYKEKSEQWNELRVKNPDWIPNIENIKLEKLDLSNTDFRISNLNNASFVNSKLDGCQFDKASLKNANFQNTSLVDASFFQADLSNSNFNGAILERVNFKEANLSSANLSSSDSKIEYKDYSKSLSKIENDFNKIDDLSPQEFELLVAEIFESYGYKTKLTPPIKDGGYDIELFKEDFFGNLKAIVEVKKYSKNKMIGLSVLRALVGAMELNKANIGILVTTSYLSSHAKEFLLSFGRVKAIDRDKLEEIIKNIGSSELPSLQSIE